MELKSKMYDCLFDINIKWGNLLENHSEFSISPLYKGVISNYNFYIALFPTKWKITIEKDHRAIYKNIYDNTDLYMKVETHILESLNQECLDLYNTLGK